MTNKSSVLNNPWLGLWVKTRKTFQRILDTNPYRAIIWLALISGFVSGLSTLIGTILAESGAADQPYQGIFARGAFLFLRALMGIVTLYLGGWLLQLTGSWLGGKGSFTDVKCAVGWSNYPLIVANLLAIANLLIIPMPVMRHFLGQGGNLPLFWGMHLSFGPLGIVAAIWGFIIFLKVVGQAHKFSAWRALWSLLLSILLLIVASGVLTFAAFLLNKIIS